MISELTYWIFASIEITIFVKFVVEIEKFIMWASNVASFTECVLQLVSNSLNANATAIAIRIYVKERNIQVVDNGTGIPKQILNTVAEYDMQNADKGNILDIYNCTSKNQTLANIRRLSGAVMISSRYYISSTTYMKIFKGYHAPNIVTIPERAAYGTTVSIYGFHELTVNKWNVSLMCHLLANIAMVNPQASFSIRDDGENKLITKISKPSTPIEIFQPLYNRSLHRRIRSGPIGVIRARLRPKGTNFTATL